MERMAQHDTIQGHLVYFGYHVMQYHALGVQHRVFMRFALQFYTELMKAGIISKFMLELLGLEP